MRRPMRKPRDLLFKRFTERKIELDNYLPLFPGSRTSKKIPPKELNNILLHTVPNGWTKQAYLQGWDFKGKTYKETCETVKRMYIVE